ARDLGERLDCGAYVESLRRTRVGPFIAANAISIDADAATVRGHVLPVAAAVAELPRLVLKPDDVIGVRHGRSIPLLQTGPEKDFIGDSKVALVDAVGELVSVARVDSVQLLLLPDKVLPKGRISAT